MASTSSGQGVSHSLSPNSSTSQGQALSLQALCKGVPERHFLVFLLKQHLLQNMSKHLGFSFQFRICQCFRLEAEVFLLMW